MTPRSRIAFERVDQNDPTLSVDGLSDFLPKQVSSDDPMLSVNALEDFFAEEPFPVEATATQASSGDATLAVNALDDLFEEESFPAEATATIEQPVAAGADLALEANSDSLEDYFRPRDEPPMPPAVVAYNDGWEAEAGDLDGQSDQSEIQPAAMESHGVTTLDDDLRTLSEIRRAALEFQRFAEQFHAFASECSDAASSKDPRS